MVIIFTTYLDISKRIDKKIELYKIFIDTLWEVGASPIIDTLYHFDIDAALPLVYNSCY